MKCVILQPSYIPWRGYFHQIALADVFVFYDDVQYDKHGWRNRNRIKTHQGTQWLTIPVYSSGVLEDGVPINQVQIDWGQPWSRKHWQTLRQSYGKAPFFEEYAGMLEACYQKHTDLLVDFTMDLTIELSRRLGIQHTRFVRSSSYSVEGVKTERLLDLLRQVGATHYITGPSARDYLEADKFSAVGIQLSYIEYGYPEYNQLYPPYDPQVSILDLMFMTGPQALSWITCARQSWES
jgi:WbqC-like protein family